jgi:hypothetical protein
MTHVVLSRPNDFVLRIIEELVPVGEPSDHSRDHEENGEHIGREAHGTIDDSTVEIHIRVKLSLNEVRIREGDALQLYSDFDEFLFSSYLEDLLSDFFDDLCPWVVIFVYPVTEAIEKTLLVLDVFNELRNV